MKKKLFVLTVCLLIPYFTFSQNIYNNDSSYFTFSAKSKITDTLYQITPAQLRAACRIFVEHDYLRTENTLLYERIALIERSAAARDMIISTQQRKFDTMTEIIVRKDAMIANDEAIIEGLKKQVAEEQKKRKRYTLYGVGAGVVVAGVVMGLLK